VEEGETIEDAAKREMQEECGVTVQEMEKVAINTFRFAHDERVLEVHMYLVTAATGEPVETEEMAPRWFPVDQIPLDAMWDDDKY
jgi:8-oxo-dGTP diphosphatase/2-hydroxy-dATP diphosphatase